MQSELTSAVNDIRAQKALVSTDEASTKAGVVLRLLSILGWDPYNIEEIKPEYTVAGKRVDYALRINNANKVFIEVKRFGEDLETHQEQLLNYSFQEGVKLAVLTNGATWWFYLPLSEGSWEQRRFYAIEIFEQEPSDIGDRFIELLAKDNIKSGEALKRAEMLYKSRQKKHKLKEAIPKAWTKILSEPDGLLVDLLVETTEKISGFRPEIEDVVKFLEEYYQQQGLPTPDTKGPKRKFDVSIKRRKKSSISTIDYSNKRLVSFKLLKIKYQPRSWQDLLMTVAVELYQRHKSDFNKCLSLKGAKRPYFSRDPNELRAPKQIGKSKFYTETNMNATMVVKRAKELLVLFGYKESDLKIQAQ